ncbi:type VI secretion system-associated FHA domain protein TagH [uncultured Ruegeria sp.]|uniref:type VI secretion system-associated FHA domain protein TagH n=1 Tax=uncultured Ruegeria sp. TaxID=259304 RepID=UPI00260780B5|nr:type VI secretion system-associated FHA domain protein TagH [uncultured Ruegeria sp.]
MSVTLTLESAPHAQSETQKTYLGGQMVIGRGDECDWRLDDPEMFISRRHLILTDESGELTALDASSGGLFIDGSSEPLGTGNSVKLEHQMRLRLGDFVICIDLHGAEVQKTPQPPSSSDTFFDFGTPEMQDNTPKERPKDLPDPFGTKSTSDDWGKWAEPDEPAPPPRPLDQRDPFELDLNARPEPVRAPSPSVSRYFDDAPEAEPRKDRVPDNVEHRPEPMPPIEVTLDPAPKPEGSVKSRPQPSAADDDLRAALFRGLGLSEEDAACATPEDIEAIGARLRESVEGLMFLLRTRAQEKQKIRVAQTVIANSDVNPLKFLASTDEALLSIIRGRDASYLPGDLAVTGAYRDLADHQIRTWKALQTALRRMIDRFDPEEVEREMESTGFLEQIVAGGRSAKMWQLYQERYQDIAKAAEERFLGEVGADFRDAYETKGS